MKCRYLFLAAMLPMAASSLQAQSGEPSKLVAVVRPVGDSKVMGSVTFEKTGHGVKVTASIGGLTPNARHGFHIHEFGDLGSDDATSAGDHFNPDNHPHAMPDKEERHAGDLGNLVADANGAANLTLTVDNITLDASSKGILGRSVIVHAKADDGGQPSGNAGDRIGAGVIGLSKDSGKIPAASETAPAAEPTDPKAVKEEQE